MTEPNRRTLRWVALALFASIALNCLVIGLMVGQQTPSLLGAAKNQGSGGQAAANGFGQRVQQLPDEERRLFLQAMKPYRPGIRAARGALADARQHLAETIAAHEFDAAAVAAAFVDVRLRTTELQEKIQEATVVALAGLNEESRKMLVAGAVPMP